jgi:ArsR family transcriptional regulator, nickel/cobalt-responsive transcriptional repressor
MNRQRAASRMVELFEAPFLRALTEAARLEILKVLLVGGARDVGEIAEQLPQHRSVISRHLQTLEDAGIVRGVREGRRHVYAIDGASLLSNLERLLGEAKALAAFCCPPVEPARR